MIYRQGDVALRPIKALPRGVKQKNKVLAYGEVTGHCHQFTSPAVTVYENTLGAQFVQVIEPAPLLHEEHKIITLPAGIYEVVRQREEDLQGLVRQVAD
jgi:hypothetical protein